MTLANEFVAAPLETLDVGFSRKLRAYVTSAEDVLPGGNMHHAIDALTSTKCLNSEIENAFARAAAMRRCGAGALTQHDTHKVVLQVGCGVGRTAGLIKHQSQSLHQFITQYDTECSNM